MPGFDDILKNIFNENSYSINLNMIGVRNNIYTSSIGMLKYYYDQLSLRGIDYTMYENLSEIVKNKKVLHDKIISEMKKYCEDN